MSTPVLIIGASGTGKSTSLRNLDPTKTLLIQVIQKRLPFKSKEWKYFHRETCREGNIFVTDNAAEIITLCRKTSRKMIVIDDFQYMLSNEFMRRSDERGFDKFTDIGKHAWEVITELSRLAPDVCVYILTHSEETESGMTKMKTIGKLLDDKIAPEGMFTIVMRTHTEDGKYFFTTRNSGSDIVKTPIGLFDEARVDNDLAAVDLAIREYYDISTTQDKEAA